MRRHGELALSSSMVIVNPIAEECAIAWQELEGWTARAEADAAAEKVGEKDITPYLLKRIGELSGGRTLAANQALATANAGLAARIAVALRRISEPQKPQGKDKGKDIRMAARTTLRLAVDSGAIKTKPVEIAVAAAVIAGWTGRDVAKMEEHIRELEALGVKRPAATPLFYRVAAARLTLADAIEASGDQSSGEVEFVLIQGNDSLYVGAGSDHTDREVETYGITVAKQMCDKPMSREVWPYEEVATHWDELILRSWAVTAGARRLYQEGSIKAMRAPGDLISRYTDGADTLAPGTVMFGGTLPAIGGIQPAERFEFELEDPVLGRRISHGYDIVTLAIAG